jgi:hypothetical protein
LAVPRPRFHNEPETFSIRSTFGRKTSIPEQAVLQAMTANIAEPDARDIDHRAAFENG